jgi:hypothetical protein
MSDFDFRPLGERMLEAGVAPRHVRRMLAELGEHGTQLELDARQRGLDPAAARAAAREELGSDDEILARTAATPSLRSWGSRWPMLTLLIVPLIGCCLGAVLSLALAGLFYEISTSTHLVAGLTRRGAFWYSLTTGLVHLAVYLVPLVCALALVRYTVSRRLPAMSVFWLSILLLAVLGVVCNLEFNWPDAQHQVSVGAGVGYSTSLPWIGKLVARCLVFAGLAYAYRQWLLRRTLRTV